MCSMYAIRINRKYLEKDGGKNGFDLKILSFTRDL